MVVPFKRGYPDATYKKITDKIDRKEIGITLMAYQDLHCFKDKLITRRPDSNSMELIFRGKTSISLGYKVKRGNK